MHSRRAMCKKKPCRWFMNRRHGFFVRVSRKTTAGSIQKFYQKVSAKFFSSLYFF